MMHLPAIGFPWNLLGYVAAGNLVFVQLTAITGIFGLSLVVASYNALAAWVVLQMSLRKQAGMTMWIGANAVLIVIAVAGPRYVPQARRRSRRAFGANEFSRVQRLSLELDAGARGGNGPARSDQHRRGAKSSRHRRVAGSSGAVFACRTRNFQARAARIARGAGSGFLVGVIDWKPLGNGQSRREQQRRAAWPGRRARISSMTKFISCPSANTCRGGIGFSLRRDLTGLIGDFQHGSQYKVGNISGGPFSVYICYEAIFPNEVRRFTLAGAQLFVNISDDGWFGGSGAPGQHLAMARVRAVENRRWLLRDTNDGITVSVDPYGRIVARLAGEYSRRTGRSVRVSRGPDAVRALGRLAAVAVRSRRARVTVDRCARRVRAQNFLIQRDTTS